MVPFFKMWHKKQKCVCWHINAPSGFSLHHETTLDMSTIMEILFYRANIVWYGRNSPNHEMFYYMSRRFITAMLHVLFRSLLYISLLLLSYIGSAPLPFPLINSTALHSDDPKVSKKSIFFFSHMHHSSGYSAPLLRNVLPSERRFL